MSIAAIELWARATALPALWILSSAFGDRLQRLPSICLWKRLTGHDCYGCGMGRALIAICRGDVVRALHFNPLAPVAMACLAGVWLTALAELSRGGAHGGTRHG